MDEIEVQILVTGIGTVLSFVSGWLLYLLNDLIKKRKDISTISKSIISELNDIKKYLEARTKPLLEITSDPNGKTLSFHGYSLETTSFDSIMYSGIFRNLDTNIQIKLSNIYGRIKLSNEQNSRIWGLATSVQTHTTRYLENIQNYADELDKRYDEIKDAIPELTSLLNKKSSTKP